MLNLDYIRDGSGDAPLIRFRSSDADSCAAVRSAVQHLARGESVSISIDQLPVVTAIDGCRLITAAGAADHGVTMIGEPASFEWRLTPDGWSNVADLLEPFCRTGQRDGFQWLCRRGDVNVLISQDGYW